MLCTDVREVPLSRGYVALIDAADWPLVSQHRWYSEIKDRTKYARTTRFSGQNRIYVYMHRLIVGEPAGLQVDHRDGNGLNNRRSNLRVATGSQNQMNKGAMPNSTSPFKGVSWNSNAGKWAAVIRKNRKNYYLGLFVDEAKAARRYDDAARVMFGEFARLNFSEPEPRKQAVLF